MCQGRLVWVPLSGTGDFEKGWACSGVQHLGARQLALHRRKLSATGQRSMHGFCMWDAGADCVLDCVLDSSWPVAAMPASFSQIITRLCSTEGFVQGIPGSCPAHSRKDQLGPVPDVIPFLPLTDATIEKAGLRSTCAPVAHNPP